MIEYIESPSSYFTEHKRYCTTIEKEAVPLGAIPEGYCGSYGFFVQADFYLDDKSVKISFEKSAPSQGRGSFVYPFGIYRLVIKYRQQTDQSNEQIVVRKSSFYRLFMRKRWKAITPKGYYFHSSLNKTPEQVESIFNVITQNNILTLKIRNSVFYAKLLDKELSPLDLIREMTAIHKLCLSPL